MNPLLAEGLTDAIGFVAGVLFAWWLATVFGLDPLSTTYDNSAIAGVVMAGLGGGGGVQLARRWRKSRSKQP